MKQNITFSDFVDAFRNHGREDQFSYDGKRALFDWLEEIEEDCGYSSDLDVIALCCEFTEYEDLNNFQEDYGDKYTSIDVISNDTLVIPISGDGFLVQQF